MVNRATHEGSKRVEKVSEKDLSRIKRAVRTTEKLSRKVEGWSSVVEIRKWRGGKRP